MATLEPWGGVMQGWIGHGPGSLRCPACEHVGVSDGRTNRLRDIRVYQHAGRLGTDLLVSCEDGHNWLLRVEEEGGELRAVFVAVDADEKEGDEHV